MRRKRLNCVRCAPEVRGSEADTCTSVILDRCGLDSFRSSPVGRSRVHEDARQAVCASPPGMLMTVQRVLVRHTLLGGGSTPLPSAAICWLAVRPWSGSVTQPGSRPMSHSTNLGAGRGPVGSVRSAGAGADRPVMFSHRAMVAA